MDPASGIPGRLEQNNLALRHIGPSAGLTQLLWSPLQQHLDKPGSSCPLDSLSKLRAVCSEKAGDCQQPWAVPQAGEGGWAWVCVLLTAQQDPSWGETPCGTAACRVCSYAKHWTDAPLNIAQRVKCASVYPLNISWREKHLAWVNTPKMMAFPHGPTHAALVLGHQEVQRTMHKHAQPGTECLNGNILELIYREENERRKDDY